MKFSYTSLPTLGQVAKATLTIAGIALIASPAFASGSGMPYEGNMTQILNSVAGPVAKTVGALAIMGTGGTMAMADLSGGAKKMLQVCTGLSIAFTATSFGLGWLGYGGGAVF